MIYRGYIFVLAISGIYYMVTSEAIHHEDGLGIIGGREAVPHSAPYMARVVCYRYNETKKEYVGWQCGGSRLSDEYVLTAAHCALYCNWTTVMLGKHHRLEDDEGQVVINSTANIIHDEVDIALIKTPPIANTATIQNVTLPAHKRDYAGKKGTAYGWGKLYDIRILPPVLQKVRLRVLNATMCKSEMLAHELGEPEEYQFCSQSLVGYHLKGTCGGDSGGPFMIGKRQVGIIAFGSPQCLDGAPSVFTNVGYFLGWISNATGINFE